MKKAVIVTLVLCALTGCMLFAGCDPAVTPNKEFVADFDDLALKPVNPSDNVVAVDTSKIAVSDELTDDAAVRDAAAYLFNLGNDNLSVVDFYSAAASGNGTAGVFMGKTEIEGEMAIREWQVKDGDAWYFEKIGRILGGKIVKSDGSSNDLTSLLGLLRDILDLSARKYTPDGNTFYKQDGKSKTLDDNCILNFLQEGKQCYNASKMKKVEKYTDAASYRSDNYLRKSHLENDNALITGGALTEASVKRFDAEGYYEVSMKVDLAQEESLAMGVQSLRESASSKDLHYLYETINLQIWDCGLYKTYSTDNSWEATIAILNGASENKWMKYFTYNKDNVKKLVMPKASSLEWAK